MDSALPPGARWRLFDPKSVALLVLTLALVSKAAWLMHDDRRPFWDQQRYYSMTLKAERAIRRFDHQSPRELLELHPSHPPLYPLVGAAARLAGVGEWPMVRWVNLLTTLLSLAAARQLARAIGKPEFTWPLLALVAAAPLATSLSHLYYLENLLLPVSLATATLLIRRPALGRPLDPWKLGGLFAAGMLTKWTFPIFVAVPCLFALREKKAWGRQAMALGMGLAISLPWYLVKWRALSSFVDTGVTSGAGWVGAVTGLDGWLYYPKELAFAGIGLPWFLCALVGVTSVRRHPGVNRGLLVLSVAIPLVVFSLVLTKKPRHLLPLVPYLAILALWGLDRLPAQLGKWLTSILLIQVLLASLASSWAPNTSDRLAISGVRIPLLTRPHADDCGVPDQRQWPFPQVIEAAESLNPRARVLVLFTLPGFTDAGLQSLAEERGSSVSFRNIPLHFPADHPGATPFPLAISAEGAMGPMDADAILLVTGTTWVKIPSRAPVHRTAMRIREAILAKSGVLHDTVSLERTFALPIEGEARLYACRRDRGYEAAVIRLAAAYPPYAPDFDAWIQPPTGDPRPTLFERSPHAQLLQRLFSGAPHSDSELLGILDQAGHRPDVLARVHFLASPRSEASTKARGELAAMDLWCVSPTPTTMALQYADQAMRKQDRIQSATWLRRALDAGVADQRIGDLLPGLGLTDEPGWQDRLRELEATLTR